MKFDDKFNIDDERFTLYIMWAFMVVSFLVMLVV